MRYFLVLSIFCQSFQLIANVNPNSLVAKVFRGKGVMVTAKPLFGGWSIREFKSTVLAISLSDETHLVGIRNEYPSGEKEITGLVLGTDKNKLSETKARFVFPSDYKGWLSVPQLYPEEGTWTNHKNYGQDSRTKVTFRGEDTYSKRIVYHIGFLGETISI